MLQTEDVGVIEEFQEEMKTKEIEIVEKEKSVELNRERIQECQREVGGFTENRSRTLVKRVLQKILTHLAYRANAKKN